MPRPELKLAFTEGVLTHRELPLTPLVLPEPIVTNPELLPLFVHVIPVVPATFNAESGFVVPMPTLPDVSMLNTSVAPCVIENAAAVSPAMYRE